MGYLAAALVFLFFGEEQAVALTVEKRETRPDREHGIPPEKNRTPPWKTIKEAL